MVAGRLHPDETCDGQKPVVRTCTDSSMPSTWEGKKGGLEGGEIGNGGVGVGWAEAGGQDLHGQLDALHFNGGR
jgi:hypothetical protein